MKNVQDFTVNQSTLEEMNHEITEGIFPFIAFHIVDEFGSTISYQTIPGARFREAENRPDLWEVRSDDTTTPKHIMYLSRSVLSRYIFTRQENPVHYTFTYKIGEN